MYDYCQHQGLGLQSFINFGKSQQQFLVHTSDSYLKVKEIIIRTPKYEKLEPSYLLNRNILSLTYLSFKKKCVYHIHPRDIIKLDKSHNVFSILVQQLNWKKKICTVISHFLMKMGRKITKIKIPIEIQQPLIYFCKELKVIHQSYRIVQRKIMISYLLQVSISFERF